MRIQCRPTPVPLAGGQTHGSMKPQVDGGRTGIRAQERIAAATVFKTDCFVVARSDEPKLRLQEGVADRRMDRMLAIRAWERENGRMHDWGRYEAEVVPMLAVMTVPDWSI